MYSIPFICSIILLNAILLILSHKYFYTNTLCSDHTYHLGLINQIKKNKHRFFEQSPFQLNDQKFCYPQLFHWLLSYLPERYYTECYNNINIFIRVIELMGFNLFLFYILNFFSFNFFLVYLCNILYICTPISYATWNAKNKGLSTRGISLIVGHFFTYLLIIYQIENHLVIFFVILLVSYLALLISQFTFQYVLFSIPLYAVFSRNYEILIIPFLVLAVFLLQFKKIAYNYLVVQYYSKRNYYKFLADIFILPARPSIYTDFFKAFPQKFKTNKIWGIIYIYQNPLVEILTNLPHLMLIFCFTLTINPLPEPSLKQMITISIILFTLTSFRKTRFLGEPQRYIEFTIPLVIIILTLQTDYLFLSLLIIYCVIVIQINKYLSNRNYRQIDNTSKIVIIKEILKQNNNGKRVLTSNDNDFLKYFFSTELKIVKPNLGDFYKDRDHFMENFLGSYFVINPKKIYEYCKIFPVDLVLINKKLYPDVVLKNICKTLSDYYPIVEIGDYMILNKIKEIDV